MAPKIIADRTRQLTKCYPKTVNMTFTSIDLLRLLDELTTLANTCAPDDHATVEEFAALCEHAREIDKDGRLAPAAREARQKL